MNRFVWVRIFAILSVIGLFAWLLKTALSFGFPIRDGRNSLFLIFALVEGALGIVMIWKWAKDFFHLLKKKFASFVIRSDFIDDVFDLFSDLFGPVKESRMVNFDSWKKNRDEERRKRKLQAFK